MASFRAAVGSVFLACMLVSVSNARAEDGKKRQAGFYLVAAEAESAAGLPAASGENGFPELRLELTPEAASKLEKLTREHLGGRVAFVIEGEPVTLHKIRSVITGGQFRLSRCTDTACQYIYTRLVGKP
jgi:preprotein translocase subunit SecD